MMLALKMHAIMFIIYKKTVRNSWDRITDNCVAMHYNVPCKRSAHLKRAPSATHSSASIKE